MSEYDCPHCGVPIQFDSMWDALLGEPAPCPHCGELYKVEYEEDYDNYYFWLVGATEHRTD